ncbi:GDSL-type esterase/lipase family protein [Chitinophaga sp.]|uniref:GDSL-type esterase/lipase family protein n=1 Tax=Chitinophaga sp. TaxID=1869181 RepID=UPI0031DF4E10
MKTARCKAAVLILLLVALQGNASAQRKFLYNDTALYRFYALLQQADSQVVRILHLGDSHVQAGFLPAAVAAPLKAKFGDAGPGWVFPYNLAGTNGPNGYRWSSNVRWEAERAVEKGNSVMESPSGMFIRSSHSAPVLTFSSNPAMPLRSAACFYKGPEMVVTGEHAAAGGKAGEAGAGESKRPYVRGEQASGESTRPSTENGEDAGESSAPSMPENINRTLIEWDTAVSAFSLRWPGAVTFYGAVLANGEPGVLYHGIGVNGAQFAHYNKPGEAVAAQMKALAPQLVILSLGTNEAFGGVSAAQLRQEMGTTVAAIRRHAPEACILFTTPPSGMMKKRQVPYRKKGSRRVYYRTTYARNPQVAVIREAMVQYCKEKGFAWWDLYQAMPQDKRFARAWSGDRVHFNAYGYTLQGTLLYEALEAGYSAFNR